MDQEEKEKLLERMRKALKAGNEERREIRSVLTHYMGEAAGRGFRGLRELTIAIREARGRGLLAEKTTLSPDGKEQKTEIAEIKSTKDQPYEKRPSVRASREFRRKGGRGR